MRFILVTILAACLTACATPDRNPVPVGFESLMTIEGYGPVRMWGDEEPENLVAMMETIRTQSAAAGRHTGPRRTRVANFLAISGGGSDGAYGAGLLNGWTAAGTRPEFDVVTGVSTGALTAPFAFLGSAYDPVLREIYTQYDDAALYEQNALPQIFRRAAIYDTERLQNLIARYVNDDVVAEIAEQHQRGRRLLIGTAHLDAQRAVIWDIGAIAASDQPDRAQLIHSIMTASAAIPGVFPAVRIQVLIDGQTYDELHVDGGTVEQVFLFPIDERPNWGGRIPDGAVEQANLYVIRNGKLDAEWQTVQPTLAGVASRTISTLIKRQAVGDLNRLYRQSEELGLAYHLAAIPNDFDVESESDFDTNYMRALLARGESDAESGYDWQRQPPVF